MAPESRTRLLIVFCDAPSSNSLCGERTAYAHPQAWGGRLAHNSTYPHNWCDLDFMDDYDRKAPISGFRLHSQIDSSDNIGDEPYGVEYGFRPDSSRDVMTLRDVERYGRTLAHVERSLQRDAENIGYAASFGATVLRLAKALKADAIVIGERPAYYGGAGKINSVHWLKSKPGRAIADIDYMVRKARLDCRKLVGKETADA